MITIGYHRNVSKYIHTSHQVYTLMDCTCSVSICFSVRYPIEKDILNKLHENITLNQVKNFDILNRQQNYMIEWREEEMAHLSNIKDIQHEMHNQFENLKDVNEETIHQMTSIHDRMMDMKHQSQSMMNEHQQSIELYRDKIQNHFHGLVSHQQDTMNGLYDAILSDINGLNSQLQEMVSIQSDAIDAWNEARVSQTEYIHTWESLVVSVNRSMNEIINASMAEIHDMQGDLKEIHYQIGSFIQPIKGFNDLFTLLFSGKLNKDRQWGMID
ncbi:hypothetical protein BDB01DRAFT_404926 [Pilobolus umbonatus]|nr:hypothetical protein BDB01DRAFT_404926 [Pilobolus umbonatus]